MEISMTSRDSVPLSLVRSWKYSMCYFLVNALLYIYIYFIYALVTMRDTAPSIDTHTKKFLLLLLK